MGETVISEAEISKAADELRTAIALKCGELADQILGRPELGSPEWVAEQGAKDTPEGRARLAEWDLVKLRIYREAGTDPTGAAINARQHGASWADIGAACGTSRQAAHERWGHVTKDPEPELAPQPDVLGDLLGIDPRDQRNTFADDVSRRCRWAVDHNDGHPSAAWSTGEQLAVALVLADGQHLDDMDYTIEQAMERVAGGMLEPPRDLAKWLTNIRATY
jgi:hypothetical protein